MKMNKIAAVALAVALAVPAFAQEQSGSSNGKETPAQRAERDYSAWLPSAGEFSIGFGLDPLSTWVGQLFNGATSNTLDKFHGDPMTGTPTIGIMGSYQLSSQLGVKANIGFHNGRMDTLKYVLDDAALFANPLSEAKVTDRMVAYSKVMSFAIGADYRIGGKHAVQAVLGAGLIYTRQSEAYKFSYGNTITEANQTPTTTVFNGPKNTTPDAHLGFMPGARLLERTKAINTFGLYGSVGVEWFFVPKVCLGANVNIQLTNEREARGYDTWEGWNVSTQKHEEAHTDLGERKVSNTTFATSHLGSNLYISFYF